MLGDPSEKYYSVHATPRGINDARPTALSIIHNESLENAWPGKDVLITGGGSSIGLETARALHATGATVYITVRDAAKGEAAIDDIMRSDPSNKAPMHMVEMDMLSLSSVRAGAAVFLKQSGNKLDLLICNAGIMATPYELTDDGHESQFATNYLSHFLLFQLLRPALLSPATREHASRVITLASESHRASEVRFGDHSWTSDYSPPKAYGASKTACIYMASSIDRRYGAQNLHALSVHPGAVRSGLTSHLEKLTAPLWKIPSIKAREKSAAQGAATTVYAATSKNWEGRGGKFLSNCMVMKEFEGKEGIEVMDDGYASWAYDIEKEDRLWQESLEMVGLQNV